MKEYKLVLDTDLAVNLPLAEENGHIVLSRDTCVLSEETAHLGGHVLYSFDGHLVCGSGSSLQEIRDMMRHSSKCQLTLVFRSPIDIEHLRNRTRLKFPVPEDFFNNIPSLSDTEIENYKALAKSWVKGLLEASTSLEGFHYVCQKDGVDIYQGLLPGSTSRIHLVRGHARVKSTRDEMRAFMVSHTTDSFRRLFHMIDSQFQDGLLLHQFAKDYKHPDVPFFAIKWAVMGAPHLPVWLRDALWLEYGDIIKDDNGKEVGFGVASSIERPECPTQEHHKLVRAELLCSGYVFRDTEEPGYIDVTYVIQADPKGWLPKWVINQFAWQQALNVSRIRNCCEGISHAVERMKGHDRHGGLPQYHKNRDIKSPPVQGVLVSHGQSHRVLVHINEPCSTLAFGFCTVNHDIGFFIEGLEVGEEWSDVKRFPSHQDPVIGKVVLDKGMYYLCFDNTYSWFKSKQIYYWYSVNNSTTCNS